ncbi:glycoside hydrolase [Ophiostoma piceae UAMH 11346]|uniref:Glycoside hydrolase n=1 Tax=Ophiostoma piceae (strain UAMH 11346) TaxID=1262450 RepID=S3BWV0_OPHP1|nr:glycoside hydrolase [Ophiostoma piceae UAMH 11346]
MLAYIVASLFVAAANAHMVMSNPVPYSSPQVINSPLNADGSNFPCQLSAGESLVSGSASNTFALGSEQKLAFIGQAVHGGGSCQVSITYDKNPSASSTWKVIQSIVGGCPAQNQVGNMGDNAAAVDPYTYNFTVPDNIPTGDVTLAWTWFNKIGNREMYMNCAPVTLTGTSGSESSFDSLPDMFVANVGNGCSTAQSADLIFPDPGEAVVSLNGATTTFASPVGSCQCASGLWSVAMEMAAGTTCTGGGSSSINIVASSSKHRRNAARMAARMAPRVPRRK